MKFRNKSVKVNKLISALWQVFNEFKGENVEFHISGHGVDEDPVNMFSIDSQTGEVLAHRSVDREQYEKTFHVSKLGIGGFFSGCVNCW